MHLSRTVHNVKLDLVRSDSSRGNGCRSWADLEHMPHRAHFYIIKYFFRFVFSVSFAGCGDEQIVDRVHKYANEYKMPNIYNKKWKMTTKQAKLGARPEWEQQLRRYCSIWCARQNDPLSLNNKTHSHILYNTLAPALALAAASALVSAPAPALAMGLHTRPNQSIIAATQRHSRQRQHRKNTQLRLNQSNQPKHHLNRSILPSRKRAR